jgi:HSP20 family protein
MAYRQSTMSPSRENASLSRRTPAAVGLSPYRTWQRMADDMDRMMSGLGLDPRWAPAPLGRAAEAAPWAPDIDVYQKDDQLVIKADLPGLRKDEVSVEIADDAVTIQGARNTERNEDREGYFRSERSYGSFCRVIPLPEGAMTDQAKAGHATSAAASHQEPQTGDHGRAQEVDLVSFTGGRGSTISFCDRRSSVSTAWGGSLWMFEKS